VGEIFARYGRVDSVRVFPAKAYAFVNYADTGAAAAAMTDLEGTSVPLLTGAKPLVMRYQQEGGGGMLPPGLPTPTIVGGMPRVHSESALGLAAASAGLAGLGVFGGADALSGRLTPGLSMDVLAGAWGLGGEADLAAAWGASDVQRSHSVGLMGHSHSHHHQSAFLGSQQAAAAAAAAAAGTLGGPMQRAHTMGVQGVPSAEALTRHRAALPPMPPRAAHHLHGHHNHNHLAAASLLSSLSALQRAASAPVLEGPVPRLGSPPKNAMGPQGPGPVPPHLLCPLSNRIMVDPVVAADGVTYERGAIIEWMAIR
jgi:hypothetical protein